MRFYLLLQREEGRIIPRWRMGSARGVLGELTVASARDAVLRRHMYVARLVDPERPLHDLVTPLKDAQLLYIDHERIVLAGFEQINNRDFAQTWMAATTQEALHALG